jgi:hypothetical protein
MKNCYQLIPDRRYFVKRIEHNKLERIEGIFVQLVSHSPTCALMRNMKRKSLPNVSHFGFCFDFDIYYDIEEIRDNARKAIESFEHRSVNLILKRLINEEFEW